ncbi:unnamed protein product, partial [Ectocarpus sp. 12 AP-2014]
APSGAVSTISAGEPGGEDSDDGGEDAHTDAGTSDDRSEGAGADEAAASAAALVFATAARPSAPARISMSMPPPVADVRDATSLIGEGRNPVRRDDVRAPVLASRGQS